MQNFEILTELKNAARIKHLLYAEKNIFKRIIGKLYNPLNLIDYRLGQPKIIPNEFIRQEPWEIEYLFTVASHTTLGILETGRFNGGSALIFSAANNRIPIYSIDINPQNDEKLLGICKSLNIGYNLDLIIGDSQKTKYSQIKELDLIFIDGDHSFEGCLSDLINWWPNLVKGGHVLLHDCYLGSEVQRAVIKFLNEHTAQVIVSPYIPYEHRRNVTGSICHFVKL
jgi:hypothetical protein